MVAEHVRYLGDLRVRVPCGCDEIQGESGVDVEELAGILHIVQVEDERDDVALQVREEQVAV